MECLPEGGRPDRGRHELETPLVSRRCRAGMRHLRESAYLRRRVAWLDAQFKDVPTLMASLKSSGQTVPYVADGVAIEPAADGARRIVSAAVRSAVQVDVFVNGLSGCRRIHWRGSRAAQNAGARRAPQLRRLCRVRTERSDRRPELLPVPCGPRPWDEAFHPMKCFCITRHELVASFIVAVDVLTMQKDWCIISASFPQNYLYERS